MYAWFFRGQTPISVMARLFQDPKCNLNEFWKSNPTQLHFRFVENASPLCNSKGVLVSDSPFDTFLFVKGEQDAGKPQHEWKPFELRIEGKGKTTDGVWVGVHRRLVDKLKIEVPKLRELHERKIKIVS